MCRKSTARREVNMKEALVKAKAEMIYLADYVGGTWVEHDMMLP